MKRIIAMAGVLAVTAASVAYVATSPHSITGGPFSVLDAAAASLIARAGPIGAMVVVVALGAVLALLASAALRDGAPSRPLASMPKQSRRKRGKPDPAPGPVWTPEPLSSEDRIASLRRRTASETGRAAPEPAGATLTRPVILLRKPRDPARDWFDDRSWLGGLPRLGQAEWPRDASGTPLPFAAQIDLAELATACPENPLPRTGSLAFFLGTGAVLHVPATEPDFSAVPDDLPPAFDEGGYPFPARPNRLSRPFFPFWPVEPVALELPAELRDHRDPAHAPAISEAMAGLLARHAAPRSNAFSAEHGDPAPPALWWHGANHLADQLHAALDGAGRLVTLRRDSLQQAEAALASLETADEPDHRITAARAEVDRRRAALDSIEAQRDGLPDMIAAIDQFVTGRETWERLDAEECGIIADFLAELHASFGDVTQHHAPHSTGELATLSLRTMITDTTEALDAMPADQLERINHAYRLPVIDQHQMFGLAGGKPLTRDEHRNDILLLQLAYDDMMEWRWSDVGLFQFWISPNDAVAGNWNAARLTFGGA